MTHRGSCASPVVASVKHQLCYTCSCRSVLLVSKTELKHKFAVRLHTRPPCVCSCLASFAGDIVRDKFDLEQRCTGPSNKQVLHDWQQMLGYEA